MFLQVGAAGGICWIMVDLLEVEQNSFDKRYFWLKGPQFKNIPKDHRLAVILETSLFSVENSVFFTFLNSL